MIEVNSVELLAYRLPHRPDESELLAMTQNQNKRRIGTGHMVLTCQMQGGGDV